MSATWSCPGCGFQNRRDALRCEQCHARPGRPARRRIALRRFIAGFLAFVLVTAAGIGALVYVHQTARPLDDPPGGMRPHDANRRNEAFAGQQARTRLPPIVAGVVETAPALPEHDLHDPSTTAATAPLDAATGAPAMPAFADPAGADIAGSATAGLLRALPDGDAPDLAQAPDAASGLSWNREILPPTRTAALDGNAMAASLPGASGAGRSSAPHLDPDRAAAPHPPANVASSGRHPASSHENAGTPHPETTQSPEARDTAPATLASATPVTGTTVDSPPARSLHQARLQQCGSQGFFGRLVCEERVRLSFCEGRWNSHPDCIVDDSEPRY